MYAQFLRDKIHLSISTVVLFELRVGLNVSNQECMRGLLRKITCLPFDRRTAEVAADLSIKLRKNRIQVESSDLFIAATAIAHDLSLATLNRKHFERIEGLMLVDDTMLP
jgi:predicted nucleic acid-binding protein